MIELVPRVSKRGLHTVENTESCKLVPVKNICCIMCSLATSPGLNMRTVHGSGAPHPYYIHIQCLLRQVAPRYIISLLHPNRK